MSVRGLYAVLKARVILTAKTSLDEFSLSREQVWTFSILGDRNYSMRSGAHLFLKSLV